jgi:hypothetical protein
MWGQCREAAALLLVVVTEGKGMLTGLGYNTFQPPNPSLEMQNIRCTSNRASKKIRINCGI